MKRSCLLLTLTSGLFLFSQLLPACVCAHWQVDGEAVCTAAWDQQYPQLISDGAAGAIVAWHDSRNGYSPDIYAQRLDAGGSVKWTNNGVAVCTTAAGQYYPRLVSDSGGGAIIAWQDYRNGGHLDIYAQRLDASGTAKWALSGVAVCTATGDQWYPRLISDGAAGAIIAWQDYREDDSHVYAQRVDASGSVTWPVDGVAVCSTAGKQSSPQMISDGTGGAIIAWENYNNGDYDVYTQRVDAGGAVKWGVNGVAICTTSGYQLIPQVICDGAGGAIIVWQDRRSGPDCIYAQRVDANGAVKWAANGILVCTAAGSHWYPQGVSDGGGGAVITWWDCGDEHHYIYAQNVDSCGVLKWGANGIVVCTADNESPRLVSDGMGGAIIAWDDYRNGTYDVYAQRVDANGVTKWLTDGVAVCTAAANQYDHQLVSDGAGGASITWDDYRSGNHDIYSQHVGPEGQTSGPPVLTRVRDVPRDQGGKVTLVWTRSALDASPLTLITHYSVWRSLSPEELACFKISGANEVSLCDVEVCFSGPAYRVTSIADESYAWEWLTNLPAHYFEEYSYTAATLFDSLEASTGYHYFLVSAHTSDPFLFWDSEPDSGYSVDNLSPDLPAGLAGKYMFPPSQVLLTWRSNKEADLSRYDVYRGDNEGFVPDESNRIGMPPDTFFVDDGFDPNFRNYYKVSARDIHENESEYAILRPEEITGVSYPSATPAITFLEQNVPNPFNPTTTIRFAIAKPGWVVLTVFDITGRFVRTLVEGWKEPGMYSQVWDGRGDNGSRLPSGVYFYRLETGYVLEAEHFVATQKMVLIQ